VRLAHRLNRSLPGRSGSSVDARRVVDADNLETAQPVRRFRRR
jgi:hypothetical protein